MNFQRMSGNHSTIGWLTVFALAICIVLAGCIKDPVSNDQSKNNQSTTHSVDFGTTVPDNTTSVDTTQADTEPNGTMSVDTTGKEPSEMSSQEPTNSELDTVLPSETIRESWATEPEDENGSVPNQGIELPEDSWTTP